MHLAIELDLQFWELIQYLSHLVSSLTATDVDDALRVGVLGEGLRNASFSASESARNSASSSQDRRIESVQNSLSCQEWLVSLQLLECWSWGSHRPEMTHAQLLLFSIDGLNDANWLGDGVLSLWEYLDDSSIGLWINHDPMILEKRIFVHITQLVSTCDQVADSKGGAWVEVPELVLVEARELDTSWDKHTVCSSCNFLKWSLDTVKNSLQDTYFH
jgi:hypothetical protein